jgi:hypothetical protein
MNFPSKRQNLEIPAQPGKEPEKARKILPGPAALPHADARISNTADF